ncbi:hypothetical protein C7S14_1830 [Burkholderia cepacia]|nr:hypothetical protein C7S14_1830 [Burkholderia cepacia]
MHLHGLSFLVIRFSKCFHYRQTIRAGMPPAAGASANSGRRTHGLVVVLGTTHEIRGVDR